MLFIQIANELPIGHPILAENLKYIFPNLNLEEEVPDGYARFISGDKWSMLQKLNENQVLDGGEYEWDEAHENIIQKFTIRDLTTEEVAIKIEIKNNLEQTAMFNQPIET